MAAGFAAANELPALSMAAMWCLLVLYVDFRGAIVFVLGILIVAGGFFATNWIAHESLRPPYTHRDDGASIARIESEDQPSIGQIADALSGNDIAFDSSEDLVVQPSGEQGRLVVQAADQQLFALRKLGSEQSKQWELKQWDDWYDYPDSYWVEGKRRGIDLGEPRREVYLFHATVGHHGIMSLTPIWLLVPNRLVVGLSFGTGKLAASGLCNRGFIVRVPGLLHHATGN